MNTMTLIETTPHTTGVGAMTDAELENWFGEIGLGVTVVPHCDTAPCAICFPYKLTPAQAA